MMRFKHHSTVAFITLAFLGLTLSSCSIAPEDKRERDDQMQAAKDTIAFALGSDPTLGAALRQSVGYAVFPQVGKGAFGVGTAHGRGNLFIPERTIIGYCDLYQTTIGLQIGGQAYSEIIVFKTQDALNTFTAGNFQFDAQTSAVALCSGAAANAKYIHGVAVFTTNHTGLMYEASLGGQKFNYQPLP